MDRLLTIDEAARYLNVSKASLRRWTKSGRLACSRVGVRGERRFATGELDAFLRPPAGDGGSLDGGRLGALGALDEAAARGAVRHVCAHFTDAAESWRMFLPYFRSHAASGAPVFYIHDSTPRQQFLDDVRAAGFDPDCMIAGGMLDLVHSSQAYLRDGTFSAAAMIAFVADVIGRARRLGHRRALVSGEMTWSLSGAPGADAMIEYEDRLNDLLRASPEVTIVCHYSIERFDSQVTLDALRVHPFVQLPAGLFRGFHNGPSAPTHLHRNERNVR